MERSRQACGDVGDVVSGCSATIMTPGVVTVVVNDVAGCSSVV